MGATRLSYIKRNYKKEIQKKIERYFNGNKGGGMKWVIPGGNGGLGSDGVVLCSLNTENI